MPVVCLRPASFDDRFFLLELRNDPISRKNSINTKAVPYSDHVEWLSAALSSTNHSILIGIVDDKPIGVVRFERQGHCTTVSIIVDPSMRKHGVGQTLLADAIRSRPGDETLVAQIRKVNTASIKLFERNGFRMVAEGPKFATFHMEPRST